MQNHFSNHLKQISDLSFSKKKKTKAKLTFDAKSDSLVGFAFEKKFAYHRIRMNPAAAFASIENRDVTALEKVTQIKAMSKNPL